MKRATGEGRNAVGKMPLTFVELFAGIGGFRCAAERHDMRCVFASDIDEFCQRAYEANFGDKVHGDITKIDPKFIPDHDVLLGGFPCQPFSIIGDRRGFQDMRGTLFFNVARIIDAKRPKAFVLENVKQLAGHDKGRTLRRILDVLSNELGYSVDYRILNALNFGLPQKRERVFIVGVRDGELDFDWNFPVQPMKPLSAILEKNVARKHYASKEIMRKRLSMHTSEHRPGIWHENKSGNISSYPYSCALRAGASYNYLLVDGKRRLTPREMLRLQGFPESFRTVVNESQTRKQAGNAVPVPMVQAVLGRLLERMREIEDEHGTAVRTRAVMAVA